MYLVSFTILPESLICIFAVLHEFQSIIYILECDEILAKSPGKFI